MRKQTSPFCGYVKQAAYFAWPFSYLTFVFAFEIAASSDTGTLLLARAPYQDSGSTNQRCYVILWPICQKIPPHLYCWVVVRAFSLLDPLSCDQPSSPSEHVTWIPQERSNMQPAEDIIQAGMWSLRHWGGCRDRGQARTCLHVSTGANKHF